MPVTSQQVAEAAGVSRGTVYRALNNRGRINPEVADRIRRIAEDIMDSRMFEEQSKIILKLAKKAPGIFLGRCANFVLAELPHTYSFFIYADDAYREEEGKKEDPAQTLAKLKERDEKRNEYYLRYTGSKRNDPTSYDLVINVSRTGVAGAVRMILAYVNDRESE